MRMENEKLLQSLHHREAASRHVQEKSADFIHSLGEAEAELYRCYDQIKHFAEVLQPAQKQNLVHLAGSSLKKAMEFIHGPKHNLEHVQKILKETPYVYDSPYGTMRWESMRSYLEHDKAGFIVVFKDETHYDTAVAKEKIRKKIVNYIFANVSPFLACDNQVFFLWCDAREKLDEMEFVAKKSVQFRDKNYQMNLVYVQEEIDSQSDLNGIRISMMERLQDAIEIPDKKTKEEEGPSTEIKDPEGKPEA